MPSGEPDPGVKRITISAVISNDARDTDNMHRFTTEQVRLMAVDRKDGDPKEYFLAGINEPLAEGKLIKLYRGEGIARASVEGDPEFEFVFEVPDKPEFKPLYLEYKLNARAEVRVSQNSGTREPPKTTPAKNKSKAGPQEDQPVKEPGPVTKRPSGDRVSGIGGTGEGSFFSNALPFKLTNYDGMNIEVGSGEIRGGRIVVPVNEDWQPEPGSKPPIERFQVPSGQHLLQLSVRKLHPESWLGQIYGGMIDKLPITHLIDSGGKQYQPVGVYAIANVDGRRFLELIYLNEEERVAGHLPKFSKIKASNLSGDYVYYFLFHVPGGTQPVKLKAGRSDVDLTPLNLAAPR